MKKLLNFRNIILAVFILVSFIFGARSALAVGTITKQFDFSNNPDGANPYGSLINISGVLYGTTVQGGANNVGTLFAWDPVTNTITKQFDFSSYPTDGRYPYSSLINIDGVLYGTTGNGGANNFGTLFAWDPVTNTITKQYDFNSSDGNGPAGSLININGVLYGTTSSDFNGCSGAHCVGTLFAWDPVTNTITKQYDFNTTDGAYPYGSLINISGVLYGTTVQGGANNVGTLFAWDPTTNTITKQYDFNATDGAYPYGSLINISGVLYGTTSAGGAHSAGTLFAWDPVTNTITKQYDFNTTDGAYPYSSLINIDGVLYGTTGGGGAHSYGTLFAWDPVTNTITKQYDFNTTDGAYPNSSLINIDGVLYGTTANGGAHNAGTLFAISDFAPIPTCTDGIQNQDETGIDIGGVCPQAQIHHTSRVSSIGSYAPGYGPNIRPATTVQNSTDTTTKFQFTKNLSFGMTDSDVLELQKFLNANGYTIANTGAGSTGHETNYFGSATKLALIKFQKANNITPAVGLLGPITLGVVNNLIK